MPVAHKVIEPEDEDDFGLVAADDGEDAFPSGWNEAENFQVELEETLTMEYDFHTLLKPTPDNFNDYCQAYNIACKVFEKAGDNVAVKHLIDIRFAARKRALDGDAIILNVSPYSDEGAAICYGYVEGSQEMAKAGHASASGQTVTMPSSIDLVNGDF